MHPVLLPQTAGTIFTTGTSSLVLDQWVLQLQHFNIWFEHISGKKNVVADAISRLRTLGLYQDNGNTDLTKKDDDIVDNIMEEVHAIEWIPNSATYKIEKLNLDVLREAKWQDAFCTKKAKSIRSKEEDGWVLNKNGILLKFIKLKYTIESTIVVLRKLTSLIIIEFHNDKGHQCINCTVNMISAIFGG